MQQLWSGSVMLPSILGLIAEHRLCAFAVRGCSQSVQAAAHLPLQLEGVVQTAEDVGVCQCSR